MPDKMSELYVNSTVMNAISDPNYRTVYGIHGKSPLMTLRKVGFVM